MSRFDYIKYDNLTAKLQAELKAKFQDLESFGTDCLRSGRWHSLFLTHLEFAYMAVGKQLRDDQIARGSKTLEEDRSNS